LGGPSWIFSGVKLAIFDYILSKMLNWRLNHSEVKGIWKTEINSRKQWLLLLCHHQIVWGWTNNSGEQLWGLLVFIALISKVLQQ